MRLTEIAIEGQEPLLIIMLRKLLDKGARVWVQGSFSKLQVKGIGKYVVDQPAAPGRDEYHGMCYDIKVHNGVGFGITPPEAETDWELKHVKSVNDSFEERWDLKRVKK
jgi:hypothetical protein